MEREEYNGINLIFWEGNGFLSFYSKKTPTSKVGDGKYNGKENSMQGDHPGILFF